MNLANEIRVWLKQKARKRTFRLTEWHVEAVKLMSDEATKRMGREVSQNTVMKEAIMFLSLNFDPQMFVSPSTEKQAVGGARELPQ